MSEARDRKDFFDKLVDLMETLRSPKGCPWDREQTRETLKPMLVEEAYEVLEALDLDDPKALCEELGDLLFQIIFHSQIAEERGEFDAYDVCKRVYEKMVGRHPHVFGDMSITTSEELLRNWEDLKKAEKEASGTTEAPKSSLLEGVPPGLPALYATYQITSKAARVGFDWPDIEGIHEKIDEEFHELVRAREEHDPELVKEEVGDLLFAAVNVARKLEIDPETALRKANTKFMTRFQGMEKDFDNRGSSLRDASLEEMEKSWQNQKRAKSKK